MDPLTQNDQANKTKPSQNEPLPYQVNTLLLIQDRNSLRIWDYETQQHIAKIQFKYHIDNAVFSPGGNFIAVFGSDGIVRIYGVKRNQ